MVDIDPSKLDPTKLDIMGFFRTVRHFIWEGIKIPILWFFNLPEGVKISIFAIIGVFCVAIVVKAIKERDEWRHYHH